MKIRRKDKDDKNEKNFDVDKGMSHLDAMANIFDGLCVFCEVSADGEGTVFAIDTDCFHRCRGETEDTVEHLAYNTIWNK